MRIIELFAGIGACSTALKRNGIDLEIVDAVEIDKYAIASFNAIHETNFEIQDITKWDKDFKDIDLITHGSPCQDFSIAGKQAGGDIGSGTRSSLMYETIRIVGKIRPKYVLWENVKNVLSKKHKHNFDSYIETMKNLGYTSYYQVLNAKDYGVPQNRERVYTISIRNDIDNGNFTFPEKQELKLRLKDMLEETVEQKYYLSEKIIGDFIKHNEKHEQKDTDNTTRCIQLGNLKGGKWDKINESCRRFYSGEGISPTIHTCQGGNTEPKIIIHEIKQNVKIRKYPVNTDELVKVLRNAKLYTKLSNKEIAEKLQIPITKVEHFFRKDNSFSIPGEDIWFELKEILHIETNEFDKSIMTFEEREGIYEKANRIYDENGIAPTLTQQEEKVLIKNATKKGYVEAVEGDSINLVYPNSETRRGRVGHQVSQTLTVNNSIAVLDSKTRIRKLTPKECWRLMGFSDEDFEKAQSVPMSNTQLYKQAGNSIVVNVLEKIFKNLFEEANNE